MPRPTLPKRPPRPRSAGAECLARPSSSSPCSSLGSSPSPRWPTSTLGSTKLPAEAATRFDASPVQSSGTTTRRRFGTRANLPVSSRLTPTPGTRRVKRPPHETPRNFPARTTSSSTRVAGTTPRASSSPSWTCARVRTHGGNNACAAVRSRTST